MIEIDGSTGEGGGQVLRTALSLSLCTGLSFHIERIRARRPNPGLRPQHLTAVRAAEEVGRAEVRDAEEGATELTFRPREVRPGDHVLDIGTAGSTTLVIQTVLPALLTADGPSSVSVKGGTHNPHAPPWEFLDRSFLPLVAEMGPSLDAHLEAFGFYPSGGGEIAVSVEPVPELGRLHLRRRGDLGSYAARAIVARLPRHIAERELDVLTRMLAIGERDAEIVETDRTGPGNVCLVEVPSERVVEVFTAHGRKGLPAEKVARRAGRAARRWIQAGVPIGEHLADQLLLPMALAGGGSFRTLEPTSHTRTNAQVIRTFLPAIEVTFDQAERDDWTVEVVRTG